jgi:GntR family transcriptional repressor for pyruvate dehydrogenase complex
MVQRELVRDVIERGLGPGDSLDPEAVMLERFEVGRASLREALRILEVHGLIRIKPGPGGGPVVVAVDGRAFAETSSFYFNLHGATLRQAIEAKLVLEPALARLAAEQLTKDGAARLTEALAAERAQLRGDPTAWGTASPAFHKIIAELAGNPVLHLFAVSIIEIQRARMGEFPIDDHRAILRLHERVTKAIIARDGAEAERLMRRHTMGQLQRLEEQAPDTLDEVIQWH